MKDWKKVKLGTLLTESKVISEKPSTDKRLRVKLNVLGVEKRPVTKDKKGATKYYTRKAGQFVYGKQNLHKGAFGIVPDELDSFESSLDIPAFDIDKSCYPEWIFYFFKKGNFYLKLETLAKGVGSKRIHPKQIFELDIFLPSKEEQRKVLDEIEKAESINQELAAEIQSQEENLSKLRQSILQDAVQGKLTKEWREQNPKVEPASELLKKIKAEKAQLVKEKKIRKEKPLPPISIEEIPFEIPESWEFCRMGTVSDIQRGSSPRPKGDPRYFSNVKTKNHWISIKDISQFSENNRLLNTNEFLTDLGTKYSRYVDKGELIVAVSGSTTGKSCLTGIEGYIYDGLALIRTINNINSEFLLFYMLQLYNHMNDSKFGAAFPNINTQFLKEMIFQLPPVEEQIVIVKKVNQLLSNCDVLEQEIKASKINAEKLMQSVLSKLLGEENNVLVNKSTTKKEVKKPSREIKYNSKTLLMDLVKLLQENGKLHAEDLWKMSKFPEDIDAFYAELKKQIEQQKTIKESKEKGYLELV